MPILLLSLGIFVGINSDDNLYTYGFPGGFGVVNYGIPKHGQWHHFAVVRNGSNGYVFLNGVKVSGSIDTSSTNYTHQGATVGQPSTIFAANASRFKGFISNLRVSQRHWTLHPRLHSINQRTQKDSRHCSFMLPRP